MEDIYENISVSPSVMVGRYLFRWANGAVVGEA